MKIKEFVEKYEKVTDESNKAKIFNKVKVKTYLPILVKRQYIDEVLLANLITDDDGLAKIDSIDRIVSLFMVAITAYTDLESEDMFEDYDALSSSGLITDLLEKVGDDFNMFSNLFDMRCNEELMNRNSVEASVNKYLGTLAYSLDITLTSLNDAIKGVDVGAIMKALG